MVIFKFTELVLGLEEAECETRCENKLEAELEAVLVPKCKNEPDDPEIELFREGFDNRPGTGGPE